MAVPRSWDLVAPAGPVYQAGTLSGNPLAMQAGLSTLRELDEPDAWSRLEASTEATVDVLRTSARAAGLPVSVSSVGAMFGYFLAEDPVTDWDSAAGLDRSLFARFYQVMLENGVYLAPSPFEAGFVSTVHGRRRARDSARGGRPGVSGGRGRGSNR